MRLQWERQTDSGNHPRTVAGLIDINSDRSGIDRQAQRLNVKNELTAIRSYGLHRSKRRPSYRGFDSGIIVITVQPDPPEIKDAVDPSVGTPHGKLIIDRKGSEPIRRNIISGPSRKQFLIIKPIRCCLLTLQVTPQHQRVVQHHTRQINSSEK